ncbi:MAG TPA: Fic family protein [Solirubrobacterales bacterium]|jgi:Fic family protein|nr:Fic family protein [Solirubrobacterales bacterium]
MEVADAPTIGQLVERLDAQEVAAAISAPPDSRAAREYLHWDELRRLEPPRGLSSEQWWLKIKLGRESELRPFPLAGPGGERSRYGRSDDILRSLHRIDRREGAIDDGILSEPGARQRFLADSLIEETIRSSQLDGATTPRRLAKEMLRSGHQPQDRSERMILDNYRALQFMREEMGGKLKPAAVAELQRILTVGTVDDPFAAGRLQPPGGERLRLLCDFANEEADGTPFVHPVIRAILLHFWLAYDRPFPDGNGRIGRILFYWAMQRHGYRLAAYLPISRIIGKAPGKYERAFAETETDGGDTTYFIVHQLQALEEALADLYEYVERKTAEERAVEDQLQGNDGLNGRQLALLGDAIRHPGTQYSFASHAASHRVSHETARWDLHDLSERGLLVRQRVGRKHLFAPAPSLPDRLRESTA